jgi:GT2 family glycosyltransferase
MTISGHDPDRRHDDVRADREETARRDQLNASANVSVIIATYTRAALLDECLQHLSRQPFTTADEVIVVDNGSTDDTPAVLSRHQRRFPVPLHPLHEPRAGKSHALARALNVAQGRILAFIDDDVNVGLGWLDAVRSAMSDPGVALLAGRVLPRWENTVPLWMRRAPAQHPRLAAPFALLDYPADVKDLGPRTAIGANLAFRREVIEVVGGFARHLGKLRGTLLSGEDHEFCQRVQRAGFRAVYVPSAVVYHWVPADRARLRYFLQWFYWSGITHAMLQSNSDPSRQGHSRGGVPLYLVKRSVVAAVEALTALSLGRRATALDRVSHVAFAAGYAAQRWGLSPQTSTSAQQVTEQAI